jgi:hypothetical protein
MSGNGNNQNCHGETVNIAETGISSLRPTLPRGECFRIIRFYLPENLAAASAYFSQAISEKRNAAWATTGFPNQFTSIPGTQDVRVTLLGSLNAYSTSNPTRAVNTPKLGTTDYRNVDTVTDTADALTGPPSGKTAEIQITAVNDAGESGPSAEVQAVVP